MYGPEHKFQDCMVDGDLWEFFGHTLNPTMEQVDLVIDDWGRMIRETSDDDGPIGCMSFSRDPTENNFQCNLSFVVEIPTPKNLNHHITLSFLDSEIVYVIKPEAFLDTDLTRDLVVKFLDGDDLLQSTSFQEADKEGLSKSEGVFSLYINSKSSKIPTDES